jgi:competence protein ComEC
MLVTDPASALSPSAVMSVGACAAIIWAGNGAERAAPASWPGFLRAALALLLISVAVAAALWPLWIAVFGRASLVGPLVNLVLVPLSGPLLAGGFALWAADAWLPAAAPAAANLVGAGLWLFERTCVRAAALPWAGGAPAVTVWRSCVVAPAAGGEPEPWPCRRACAALAAGAAPSSPAGGLGRGRRCPLYF